MRVESLRILTERETDQMTGPTHPAKLHKSPPLSAHKPASQFFEKVIGKKDLEATVAYTSQGEGAKPGLEAMVNQLLLDVREGRRVHHRHIRRLPLACMADLVSVSRATRFPQPVVLAAFCGYGLPHTQQPH